MYNYLNQFFVNKIEFYYEYNNITYTNSKKLNMGNILKNNESDDNEYNECNIENGNCYGDLIDGIHFVPQNMTREVLLLLTRNDNNMQQFINENIQNIKCQIYCNENLTYDEAVYDDINQKVLCFGKMCVRIMFNDMSLINFIIEVKQHGIYHNGKTYFVGFKNNSNFKIKEDTQNVPDNKLNYDLYNINNVCTFTHPFLFDQTDNYSGTIVTNFYSNLNDICNLYNDGYRLREVFCKITEGYNCNILKMILGDLNSSLCKYLNNYEFPHLYNYQNMYQHNMCENAASP